MSDPKDELAGTEQPFVQHLLELRDRLVRAMIVLIVACVILSIYPGPATLYDWLAAPLVANLPAGSKLIATSVISPFMVPLKILLLTAFMVTLPYTCLLYTSPSPRDQRGSRMPSSA